MINIVLLIVLFSLMVINYQWAIGYGLVFVVVVFSGLALKGGYKTLGHVGMISGWVAPVVVYSLSPEVGKGAVVGLIIHLITGFVERKLKGGMK